MNLNCLLGLLAGHSSTCVVKCVANGTILLATNEFSCLLPAGDSGGPSNNAVKLKAVSTSSTTTSCVASA
jgi:hypothetical protein